MSTTAHRLDQAITVHVEDTQSARAVMQRLTLAGVDGDRMSLDPGERMEWSPSKERVAGRSTAKALWARLIRGYLLGTLVALPAGLLMAIATDTATGNVLWATGLMAVLLTGPLGALIGMLAMPTMAPAWDRAGRPDATPAELIVHPRSLGQAARISAILERSDNCGPVVATDDPHGLARQRRDQGSQESDSHDSPGA